MKMCLSFFSFESITFFTMRIYYPEFGWWLWRILGSIFPLLTAYSLLKLYRLFGETFFGLWDMFLQKPLKISQIYRITYQNTLFFNVALLNTGQPDNVVGMAVRLQSGLPRNRGSKCSWCKRFCHSTDRRDTGTYQAFY